jgi:serine/threonine protein phosphatase 1
MLLSPVEKLGDPPQKKAYSVPEGWRVYAVGDIHGRADLVRVLHRAILLDARRACRANNLLVYLGDYLDRGPYVRETLEELISHRPPGFIARHLMGNHERLFLDFLENPALLEMWLDLGGRSTLMSYGVGVPGSGFSPRRAGKARAELLEVLPQKHLKFLKSLKPYLRMGDYLFVHAGIRPEVPLKFQTAEDLFWVRDHLTGPGQDLGFRVVHGHNISSRVRVRPNRIGVDTGAYATGVLTCAVLDEDRVGFLSTENR